MTAADLYKQVTDHVVAQLEKGDLQPWRCPWRQTGNGLPLRHSGIPYRGCNVLWLFMVSQMRGFSSPYFLTFNQCRDYGGNVKRGERSTPILFCQPFQKDETAEDGKKGKGTGWMARAYHVFNVEQCDRLGDRFAEPPTATLSPEEKVSHAETYFDNLGATIDRTGNAAYYMKLSDKVVIPPFETFHTADGFYSTLAHECHHWAGSVHRLGRFAATDSTREEYAREELVAELGACMTMAQLGFEHTSNSDHAAYLECWLKALRADPKYLFQVASKAQASCDHLNSYQPDPGRVLPIADHE